VYEGRKNGVGYAVLNLQGRVFMGSSDDPFRYVDRLLEQIKSKIVFVDFHAEASEPNRGGKPDAGRASGDDGNAVG